MNTTPSESEQHTGSAEHPTPTEHPKRIGFLSFGHWAPVRGSLTPTAQDALLQAIDLSVAAEELGLDGAYFRVHHFARQHGAPFPLLSAIAARTKHIEIGTGVIDMR
ncbi:MAG TPA: LLM class flavin-dependent oxidoreductase [Geminicoccaceae bacterium]|nr:LLM class flavin-dependent oxidoreductase [Geminicoccaceae bacterium]